MLPERGTGGPLEDARRTVSTSSARPSGDADPIQDSDVQMQQPATEEPTKANQRPRPQSSSKQSPRSHAGSSRAATSSSDPLMPAASDGTDVSGVVRDVGVSRASRRASTTRRAGPPEPPVTKATLSELDVSKIIQNPKLRHDINFDPELHFRPNVDGDKGRKKQQRANQFWGLAKDELVEFVTDRDAFYRHHGGSDEWTLPALLKAVKEIIQTLVPQRDRQFLDEGFNVELIMQQFYNGVADLEKLAAWLSGVLKSHCAPMRDEWVDTMYDQISRGNREADIDLLVSGMRCLLSVLEAMKLDVANHQIRCLRPVLIENTTHYEQLFFHKKIHTGRMRLERTQEWYREARARCLDRVGHSSRSLEPMAIFFEALSRLVLPSSTAFRHGKDLSHSAFGFDEERLMKLRSDMLDSINLAICMRLYETLNHFGRDSPVPHGGNGSRAQEHLGETGTTQSADLSFNRPMVSSRPSSLVFSSAGSDAGSSRSSMDVPSYVAPEAEGSSREARSLYNSLVALLQTAPPGTGHVARWNSIAPSMALQIFRFTNAPMEMLPSFEETLMSSINMSQSSLYREVEQQFHGRLMSELGIRVRDFEGLSGVSLFSVATGSRIQPNNHLHRSRDNNSTRDNPEDSSIEDMATRLAHLGILHWRVWEGLVYVDDGEDAAWDEEA